ncbi:ABC transporter permease [Streptomyces sp. NPDC056796]|uniref:ABC transporter permease n=1 Tax=unclassified Streptomyces TaxID=2593676 RepID=UPI0036800F54
MKTSLTLARFHLLSVWNWRTSHLSRMIEAPAYFLFMVTGLGTLVGGARIEGMPYDDFAYAGVLVVIAIRALFWCMGDVANDRKWGVYAVARTTDVSFSQYIGSILAANTLVATVQIAAILLLKQVLGRGSAVQDVRMAGLAVLVCLLTVLTGCALGFGVNSYSKRDLMTSLFSLPLVMTAPLFYSLDSLPAFMRVLAAVNPFTYCVLLVRSPAAESSPVPAAAGCLVAALLVAGALRLAAGRHELTSDEQG